MPANDVYTREVGLKRYELSDHLGNVRAVVSDEALARTDGPVGLKPDLLACFNYYPFGMEHPGRVAPGNSTLAGGYRFGFNGKEKDNNGELGLTNYDYGARIYNPAIARWLTLDPLQAKYPHLNPYNFVANDPVNAVDPDGKEIIFLVRDDKQSVVKQFQYKRGEFYDVATGKKYDRIRGANNTMYRLLKSYDIIEKSDDTVLKGQLHTLETSPLKHYVEKSSTQTNNVTPQNEVTIEGKGYKNTLQSTQTQLDFDKPGGEDFKGIGKTDLTTVVHEMRHEFDYDIDNMSDYSGSNDNHDPAEIRAVHNENRARDIQHLKHRTRYGGPIEPKQLSNPPNNKNAKSKGGK